MPTITPESDPRYVVFAAHPDTGEPLRDARGVLPYQVFGYACCARGITREQIAAGVRSRYDGNVTPLLAALPVERWPSLVVRSWVARQVTP